MADMAHPRIVSENDNVIFQTEDKSKVFQIRKSRNIYFEKINVKGQDIVGQPYGTLFEVQKGKLMVVKPENGSNVSSDPAFESGKDNRGLIACSENQKLTQEDIMKMKEEGISGQDIVEKLVEKSETFKTKTEFSQEKYIKKKKKKHMQMFRILQPTSRLLLETFKQAPSKICHLREDSLSQLLCYSNVTWGSRVGVVESCRGMVLGPVMDRLAGEGRVVHLYMGNDMSRHVVECFNFSEDKMRTLLEFPLNKLASLEDGSLLASFTDQDPTTTTTTTTTTSAETTATSTSTTAAAGLVVVASETTTPVDSSVEKMDTSAAGHSSRVDSGPDRHGEKAADPSAKGGNSSSDAMEEGDGDGDNSGKEEKEKKVKAESKHGGGGGGNRQKKTQRRKQNPDEWAAKKQLRAEKLQEAATLLSKKDLDSLIIATKFDSQAILMRLLPYVAPSRPVVVFSQHKEPLVECFTWVKESGCGIQLKLTETWYREYQVLPDRTHPLNNMSGTGGYLLSFVRISPQHK